MLVESRNIDEQALKDLMKDAGSIIEAQMMLEDKIAIVLSLEVSSNLKQIALKLKQVTNPAI